jgi:hypothetical protein
MVSVGNHYDWFTTAGLAILPVAPTETPGADELRYVIIAPDQSRKILYPQVGLSSRLAIIFQYAGHILLEILIL